MNHKLHQIIRMINYYAPTLNLLFTAGAFILAIIFLR